MKPIRIFISSVQKELADERRAVTDFIRNDPLLRLFFTVFLFEELPASDRRADSVYLSEVARAAVYVALFGNEYGSEDKKGLSPTEREFDHATAHGKARLIFIKGVDDGLRHPKMRALITRAGDQLIRRRFSGVPDLIADLYASLVDYLEQSGRLRTRPFDAAACAVATLTDISRTKLADFLARAQSERGYPIGPKTSIIRALTHLNLLDGDRPSHAAILLFGKQPQRFLLSSEVKCMHFHGTEIRKPIPSYHIYKGTVFELVNQALDFVMSKINRTVGTRALGPQATVEYELPREAVAEAIVNAIAHRDYASKTSVQVMLFADRLEIWNPGELHPPLTLESLSQPHPSIPVNPLIAESLYLTKYIEKAGSGTLDMIALCSEAGLPEPQFRQSGGQFIQILGRRQIVTTPEVTGEVTGIVAGEVGTRLAPSRHQVAILRKCLIGTGITELMTIARRTDRTKFRHQVLNPLIEAGLLEMTIPDKPTSSKQKYRLTEKGRAFLEKQTKESGDDEK